MPQHQSAQQSHTFPSSSFYQLFIEVSLNNNVFLRQQNIFRHSNLETIITEPTSKVEHVDAGKLLTPFSQHILSRRDVTAFYNI